MNVYTIYRVESSTEMELLRLWERSWRLRGWIPRLLTPAHLRRHKQVFRSGWLCRPGVINFSFRPRAGRFKIESSGLYRIETQNFSYWTTKDCPKLGTPCIRYEEKNWETASLVDFSGMSEDEILNCGRMI